MSSQTDDTAYRAKMRRGTLVIGGLLAVFSIVEYIIAKQLVGQTFPLLAALLLIAVAKSWYIVRDFMHLGHIFDRGDHG